MTRVLSEQRSARWLIVVALGLTLLLAACGGSANLIDEAYVAAGDGTRPADLTRTDTLRADDDLNVVVVLNAHSRELDVGAVFTGPEGDTYDTDTLEADETVGQVVLGLDWEASRNGTGWPTGEWSVDVMINDEVEQTLTFSVAAQETTGSAEG
jgi:hypothetical protein